jgi:elongation factor P--(R)-beta-lysine ligase
MSPSSAVVAVTPEDWRPTAGLEAMRLRARVLRQVRAFFERRGVLEVDTPALSAAAATDPHLGSLAVRYHGPNAPAGGLLRLHTSPEYPMKRLLAAGWGSMYQVCKVFRDGEAGRLHNPEFTLLEWYRVGFDHRQLMDEVEELVTGVLGGRLAGPAERLSYGQAFRRHAGVDPLTASVEELMACCRRHGLSAPALEKAERDAWLDLLLTHVVEPRLGRGCPSFLYDYPASQAALARVRPGKPPLAERFELYVEGIELANGFHELGDTHEQRRRFQADNARRSALGLPPMPTDEHLLAALAAGLPPCAGVALGLDRLVLVAGGYSSLDEVLAFPVSRA